MYILGINPSFVHDPSACLLRDGELVAAAEEERFVRVKHAPNFFPLDSIEFCLKFANISIADVDYIAFSWGSPFFWLKSRLRNLANYIRFYRRPRFLYKFAFPISEFLFNPEKAHLEKRFGHALPYITYIPHHLSHASSAYRCSGFRESAIVTMDGMGESTSTAMAYGNQDAISILHEVREPNSLGLYYGAFTKFLGFKPLNDEWKVMGLAPYGTPSVDLDNVLHNSKSAYHQFNYILYDETHWFSQEMTKRFGKPRGANAKIEEMHRNIAASVQRRIEQVATNIVKRITTDLCTRRLCLAGGVALNSKMNGKILHSGIVDEIFVQPAASDAGTAIGAALELYSNLSGKSNFKLEQVYLGPAYTDQYIERVLKIRKIRYEHYDDIAGICGELLAKGKIIGWFQGRMEFGPRALGNRSILADPRDAKMKDRINYFVKHREPFRPFAPSMLKEAANEYLVDPYPSPFMILTFEVPEDKRKDIPATVHVDGTCRPQTVEKQTNPLYYELVKSFEQQTGVPVILNTSFNVKGEPIVCSPQDAIRCFFDTGLDYLAIGHYLIKKCGN